MSLGFGAYTLQSLISSRTDTIWQANNSYLSMSKFDDMFHEESATEEIITPQIIRVPVIADQDNREIELFQRLHDRLDMKVPVNDDAVGIAAGKHVDKAWVYLAINDAG